MDIKGRYIGWVVVVLLGLNACRPLTPPPNLPPTVPPSMPSPTPVQTAPLPGTVLAKSVPDGAGGTLVFTEETTWVAAPSEMYVYRVSPAFTVSATALRQWQARLGLGEGRPGREGDRAWAVVTQTGHLLRVDEEGLTYIRLWGVPPPPAPRDLAATVVQSLLAAIPPATQGIALRQVALSPVAIRYVVSPLVDGLPVVANRPWGEVEVTPEGMLRYARFTPLRLSQRELQPLRPFQSLLSALEAGTLAPQAVLSTALNTGWGILAERRFPISWEVGASVRLIGQLLVLREPSGNVRAWLTGPTGTFALRDLPEDITAWATRDAVIVIGQLQEVDPAARWGVIQVSRLVTPPPPNVYRGVLRVGNVVQVEAPEGTFPLPDAPVTLPDNIPVLVEGYGRGVSFEWTRLYTRPQVAMSRPRGAAFVRSVVRVEPVYWLEWYLQESDPPRPTGYLYPAWRVVTGGPFSEIDLIYSISE